MSSVPTICPHCYRTLHATPIDASGMVRCDACGHVFPIGGGKPSHSPSYGSGGYAPPAAGESNFGSVPVPGSASFGGPNTPTAYSQPPSTPAAPGFITCAVITGTFAMCFCCCGAAGIYLLLNIRLNNGPGQNFPPGPFAAPNFPVPAGSPPFNNMPAAPPIAFPPGVPVPATIPLPGFPANTLPTPNANDLQDLLSQLQNSSPDDPRLGQWLQMLQSKEVDPSQRAAVVQVLLARWRSIDPTWSALVQQILEKWASAEQSLPLARFAVDEPNDVKCKAALNVLAKTGGDRESAALVSPLLKRQPLQLATEEVLEQIGGAAENSVLELTTDSELRVRLAAYRVLGRIGTEKSSQRLGEIAEHSEIAGESRRVREAVAEIAVRMSQPKP